MYVPSFCVLLILGFVRWLTPVIRVLPEYSHLLLILSRYVGVSSEIRSLMVHCSAVLSPKQIRTWPVAWMYVWPNTFKWST